jgi:hypothetical protein
MSRMGYINYSNPDGSGVNNFDGQGSGSDFYGTVRVALDVACRIHGVPFLATFGSVDSPRDMMRMHARRCGIRPSDG